MNAGFVLAVAFSFLQKMDMLFHNSCCIRLFCSFRIGDGQKIMPFVSLANLGNISDMEVIINEFFLSFANYVMWSLQSGANCQKSEGEGILS